MNISKLIKRLFCNHNSSCVPVRDNTKWVIGTFCVRCGRFWIRHRLPSYKERMKGSVFY